MYKQKLLKVELLFLRKENSNNNNIIIINCYIATLITFVINKEKRQKKAVENPQKSLITITNTTPPT